MRIPAHGLCAYARGTSGMPRFPSGKPNLRADRVLSAPFGSTFRRQSLHCRNATMHDDYQQNTQLDRLPKESIHRLTAPFTHFLRIEAAGGLGVLMWATRHGRVRKTNVP